ncbi:hypothetical protein [Gloeobacter kilaueensis]|uniref:Uncharacterized protein n=1 Tax=Gloeobacter kilaueensis (strain ATCC BAA-2537 / CCAP 1431/1 / ULC 316 / JS1) TaxID=1183438 RepID=U5QMS5_GLOK1|nr:hypothetical protein [Gloeobacter kilaueensis]AGY58960.1 hypothetical protein GKIL_2714 [Gloeobacter kilaueensis JS1]
MADVVCLLWILALFAGAGALVVFCGWLAVEPATEQALVADSDEVSTGSEEPALAARSE